MRGSISDPTIYQPASCLHCGRRQQLIFLGRLMLSTAEGRRVSLLHPWSPLSVKILLGQLALPQQKIPRDEACGKQTALSYVLLPSYRKNHFPQLKLCTTSSPAN